MSIEIRVDRPEDDDPIKGKPITPDGPHSNWGTRAVADGIYEAVRLLNYATSADKRGLTYPSDLYEVYGSLHGAVVLLEQSLDQMADWNTTQTRAGYVRENAEYGDHGGDAGAAAADVQLATAAAVQQVRDLAAVLGKLHAATRGLEASPSHPHR
jgi:hypothetical protein